MMFHVGRAGEDNNIICVHSQVGSLPRYYASLQQTSVHWQHCVQVHYPQMREEPVPEEAREYQLSSHHQ